VTSSRPAERIGLGLLVVGNAFSIWSALNPSPFTMRKFGVEEEDRAELRRWQLVAVVLILVMVTGVFLVFGKGRGEAAPAPAGGIPTVP